MDMEAFASVPEAATLARLASHTGLVIVDFDETLLLRNSTEEFLNSAIPALLAAVLLRLVDICSPWRFAGGPTQRDVWRVRAILLLLPWTLPSWRRLCARAAAGWANAPLLDALRGRDFLIATNGFAPLIKPLLTAMDIPDTRLIARQGRLSKLARLEAAIGPAALAGALCITDSLDDAEILQCCAIPCLTRWRASTYRRAFRQIYLPGDYLLHVKRPRVPAVTRLLVTDDLLWWLLISLTSRPFSLLALLGAGLLFFSFWSVYEIGYWENDVCALKFESDPVYTPEFLTFDTAHFELKAWVSALILGLAGTCLLGGLVKWFALLLALRGLYYVYNRISKPARIWLYLPLQAFRSLSLAAVMPLGAAGIIAGLAQILARWQGYIVYRRVQGAAWRDQPTRALQWALLLAGLALAHPFTQLQGWLALVVWQALLARKELRWRFRHEVEP
jgi:hypothetical protein